MMYHSILTSIEKLGMTLVLAMNGSGGIVIGSDSRPINNGRRLMVFTSHGMTSINLTLRNMLAHPWRPGGASAQSWKTY